MTEVLNSRQRRKLAAEEHQRQREQREVDRANRIAARMTKQDSSTSKKTPGDVAAAYLMQTAAEFGLLIRPTLFGPNNYRTKRYK